MKQSTFHCMWLLFCFIAVDHQQEIAEIHRKMAYDKQFSKKDSVSIILCESSCGNGDVNQWVGWLMKNETLPFTSITRCSSQLWRVQAYVLFNRR